MTNPYRVDPVWTFRAIIGLGFLAMLGANMPGHLSVDSVTQLHEGRFHLRETWAPAVYAAILGGFDRLTPGTGFYLMASGLLLSGSLMALPSLRPRITWLAPGVGLAVVLSPALLIYQGIVWKDVLFANLGVAGFVALAHVAKVWSRPGRPWLALIALLLTLALAAQVRQNGLIAAGVVAIVLAWTARDDGWGSVLGWSVGGLIAVVLLSLGMGILAQPSKSGPDDATQRGILVLQRYDLIGASAHDKTLVLKDIVAADPEVAATIRTRAVPLYSPERVDYLHLDPGIGAAFRKLPQGVVGHQWWTLIRENPQAYLAHRLDAFRWVFLTPMIDSCLPIFTGVEGPPKMLSDLKMPAGVDRGDQRLYNYGSWFLDTPVFSHLTYGLICLATGIVLLIRGEPQDVAMVGLMAAALGFAASFFVISVACDYRYLYFLDLAALVALIYLAVDPPLRALGLGRPE